MWTNAYSTADIGVHVAELRRAAGYSQVDFAEALGISRTTMSSLENGGPVATTLVVRAITVLGSRVIIAPKTATVTVKETDE